MVPVISGARAVMSMLNIYAVESGPSKRDLIESVIYPGGEGYPRVLTFSHPGGEVDVIIDSIERADDTFERWAIEGAVLGDPCYSFHGTYRTDWKEGVIEIRDEGAWESRD